MVTSDGYEGYSYGKHLRLRSEKEKFSSSASSSQYADLKRFDPRIGLFPNEEKQQIKIITSKAYCGMN